MKCSHLIFVLRFKKKPPEPKGESNGGKNILHCSIQSLVLRNNLNLISDITHEKYILLEIALFCLKLNIKQFSLLGLQKVHI